MKSALIALTLAVCTLAAEIPIRPVHPAFAKWNRNSKIVGGVEATPHSIPYQCGLFAGGSFCGASLISQRWALTAAHCGEISNRPQIVCGAHRIQEAESTQYVVTASSVIVHEGWDRNSLRNDIALVALPQNVPLGANIATVPLAPANSGNFAGETAVASGWGLAYDGSTSISPVLRKTESTILTNSACQNQFGSGITVYDSVMCLDGSQGHSTCSGDSGGPLTINGVHCGLTSYGVSIGCERGYPAAFTRTSSFRAWITQNSGV